MRTVARGAAVAILLVVLQPRAIAADFPQYSGFVNDFANLLSADTRRQLEELLRATEADTKAEVAVAVVSSLDGMTVEQYADGLFREWGVGKEGLDNGVLVVVAPNEREMRIEVGYGLEPVLPDGLAGEIIRTNFLPHFREDRYAAGITDGVTRIADIVRRNHVLTPEELAALEDAASDEPPMWIMIPFFGLFVGIGFFMLGIGLGSKTGFPVLFGSFFGGMPFLMSLIPFFNSSVFVLGPLAVGATAYGYRVGKRSPGWVTEMRKTPGGTSRGGWVMGASSGGSGSGRSGSGGSFGGGRSGGGGASGRW